MRITWIGGWGVAPESLRPIANNYFPGSEHTFLAPTSGAAESITKGTLSPSDGVRGAPDVTIAWSLGAWRLLDAASRGAKFDGMVMLLAPFVAFPAESKLGGKCSVTQVKYLRRWLEREPLAALTDFYERAGLREPLTRPSATFSPSDGVGSVSENTPLPYALADLLEGLDRLAEDASPALREFASRGLQPNWQALVGDSDSLLDGRAVCDALQGCTLVRGVGHSIADLLRASQA